MFTIKDMSKKLKKDVEKVSKTLKKMNESIEQKENSLNSRIKFINISIKGLFNMFNSDISVILKHEFEKILDQADLIENFLQNENVQREVNTKEVKANVVKDKCFKETKSKQKIKLKNIVSKNPCETINEESFRKQVTKRNSS